MFFISSNVLASPQIMIWYFISEECPKNTPIGTQYYWAGSIPNKSNRLKGFEDLHVEDKCMSCDNPDILRILPGYENAFIESCPNRKVIDVGDYFFESVLRLCPKEKPLRVFGGRCVECDISDIPADVEKKEDCDICPNRYFDEKKERCILKECPKDKPLRDKISDDCHACNDGTPEVFITQDSCEKCPDRIYKQGKCQLK